MDVTANIEEIENHQLQVKVSVPFEPLKEEYQKVKTEVLSEVSLPGFRKGKAPAAIVEKRFGDYLKAKTVENVIPKAWEAAVSKNEIKSFGQPRAEEVGDYKENEPLEATFKVDKAPEAKVSKIDGLKGELPEISISDSDIDEEVRKMLRNKAELVDKDGAAEEGDYLRFNATFNDEELASLNLNEYPTELKKGESRIPYELGSELFGLKQDEEKVITKKYEAEFPESKLAGKEVEITLKGVKVQAFNYPELNDEIAIELGHDNVDALKEKAKSQLENLKSTWLSQEKRKLIINFLKENAEFVIPQSLVDMTAMQYVQGMMQQLGNNEQMFAQFLQSMGKTPEQLLEEYKVTAREQAESELVLDAVQKEQSIEVKEEDIESKIESMAKDAGQEVKAYRKELLKSGQFTQVKNQLEQEAIIDFIADKGDIKTGKKKSVLEIQ